MVAAATVSVSTADGLGSTGAAPTDPVLRRWLPIYMASTTNPPPRAEAIRIAKDFDVVIAQGQTFEPYVDGMKTANPNLRILEYVNGAFSVNDRGAHYPATWYARDAQGQQIRSVYGNYLMDISNPAWSRDVAKRCRDQMAAFGDDGCFLDTLGVAIFLPGYATSMPINPATQREWTPAEWLAATSQVAQSVKAALGSQIVIPNGVSWGRDYFNPNAPTKTLLEGVDAGMVELFVRSSESQPTFYRSERDWKADVDMLVDAGNTGAQLLVTTKLLQHASSAQRESIHRFALATFLLGTNGRSYFAFVGGRSWSLISQDYAIDRTNLGIPLNGYAKQDGVYRRDFTNGLVLVNPTEKSVTVSLTGLYRNDRGSYVTTMTLPAHDGEILTRLPLEN